MRHTGKAWRKVKLGKPNLTDTCLKCGWTYMELMVAGYKAGAKEDLEMVAEFK